jgi:hypothetical protein
MSDENGNDCQLKQFQRNRYFYGKLMTVRDFEAEQEYMNGKRRLLNRLVFSDGIACGFSDLDPRADGESVLVQFNDGGVALDCCGREITVPPGSGKRVKIGGTTGEATDQDLPVESVSESSSVRTYLYLRYRDCPGEMVAAASVSSSCEEVCCPNRIIEDFDVVSLDTPPSYAEAGCPPPPSGGSDEAVSQSIGEGIRDWFANRAASCGSCSGEELLVFLAAIYRSDGTLKIDDEVTQSGRRYMHGNRQISRLLACHMADLDNPHHNKVAIQVDKSTGPAPTERPYGTVVAEGPLTLNRASAILLTPDDASDTITISENHSGNTAAHVSTEDRKRWNSSVLGISTPCAKTPIKPDENGWITLEAKGGISITCPDPETIQLSGGEGRPCLTGIVDFTEKNWKLMDLPWGKKVYAQIFEITLPALPKGEAGPYCVELAHVDDDILGSGKFTEPVELFTRKLASQDLGLFVYPLVRYYKAFVYLLILGWSSSGAVQKIGFQIQWWANPSKNHKAEPAPFQPGARADDVIKVIPSGSRLSLKEIAEAVGAPESSVEAALKELIDEGRVKVTGRGAARRFYLVE